MSLLRQLKMDVQQLKALLKGSLGNITKCEDDRLICSISGCVDACNVFNDMGDHWGYDGIDSPELPVVQHEITGIIRPFSTLVQSSIAVELVMS